VLDLAVEPFERVGAVQLGPMRGREAHVRKEERRRFAIHEIGHALAIVALSQDQLDSIWLLGDGKRPLADDGAVTAARCLSPQRAVYTLGNLETELVKLLAGTVAESVLLGSRSTGASGDGNSDLARTTLIAARIELHHGLGMMLAAVAGENLKDIVRLLQQDEELRNRVEMRLRTSHGKAEKLIRDNTDIIEQLAEELMKHGELSGDRVREIVASARLLAI
jgi:vesicle-fusing ATPase